MSNPIVRSTGGTESERYLVALAEQSFLNLWSYANLFIDKRSSANTEGKELCDLLVVCGDDVLVFSEKTIAFQDDKETPVCWQRWHRAAVLDSVKQVNGAIRWIRQFPKRIFWTAPARFRFRSPCPLRTGCGFTASSWRVAQRTPAGNTSAEEREA